MTAYPSLAAFLQEGKAVLTKGPVALILVEDAVEIATTLRHHLECGFRAVIALLPDSFDIPADVAERVHRVSFDCSQPQDVISGLNQIIATATPGCYPL